MPATPADAQVIMQLYDLRREPEMRKARNWFALEFNPTSVEEVMKTVSDFGSEGNRYFRMVTSYWEMAATMVAHGAVNEELFLDTQPEMFFIMAKLHPHLEGLREKMQSPDAMRRCETLMNKSEASKKKLEQVKARLERFRAMAAQAKA
jgi:L-rhamnose mutarotase